MTGLEEFAANLRSVPRALLWSLMRHGTQDSRRTRAQVIFTPLCIQVISANQNLTLAVSALQGFLGRGNHLRPGFQFFFGTYRILKIKYQSIGGQGFGLFKGSRIGTGHIEDGAKRAGSHS